MVGTEGKLVKNDSLQNLVENDSLGRTQEDTQEVPNEALGKQLRQENKPSVMLPDAENSVMPLSQQAWTDSQIQQLVAGPSQLSQVRPLKLVQESHQLRWSHMEVCYVDRG